MGIHAKSNRQALEDGQRTAKADRVAYFSDKIGDGKKVTPEQFSQMGMAERVMLKQVNAAKYNELANAEDHERRGLRTGDLR